MDRFKNNIVCVDNVDYYKEDLNLKYFLDKNMNVKLEKLNNLFELNGKDGFLLMLTIDDLYRYNSLIVDVDNVILVDELESIDV